MTSQTTTLTDAQIKQLSTEAGQHGDLAQVDLCRRALAGETNAREACARAIADAAAQLDVEHCLTCGRPVPDTDDPSHYCTWCQAPSNVR